MKRVSPWPDQYLLFIVITFYFLFFCSLFIGSIIYPFVATLYVASVIVGVGAARMKFVI